MKLAVRIAPQPGTGYKAWCPALPGCRVLADSRRQVRARLRRAVRGYLAHLDVALPRELARQMNGTTGAAGDATAPARVPTG